MFRDFSLRSVVMRGSLLWSFANGWGHPVQYSIDPPWLDASATEVDHPGRDGVKTVERGENGQFRAVGDKGFLFDRGVHVGDARRDERKLGEVAAERQPAHGDDRNARSEAQAFRRRAAIRSGKAARAELDTAIPARDHDSHAIAALAVDRLQHRPARGATGF